MLPIPIIREQFQFYLARGSMIKHPTSIEGHCYSVTTEVRRTDHFHTLFLTGNNEDSGAAVAVKLLQLAS